MLLFHKFFILSLLISLVSARYFNPEVFFTSRYTQRNWNIANCGLPSDVLDIKYVEISPEVIKPGDEITLKAGGLVKKPVLPGAFAQVQVKLGVVQLIKKTFDLCEELSKHKEDVELQCPINDGEYNIVQKITIPKEAPKAPFTVHVQAFNHDDEDLACLTIKVDFRKK